MYLFFLSRSIGLGRELQKIGNLAKKNKNYIVEEKNDITGRKKSKFDKKNQENETFQKLENPKIML